MTVLFIPQAQYRLDGAICWLKGWAAANADETASAYALRLVEGLSEVRDYHDRLLDGSVAYLAGDQMVVDVKHIEAVLEGTSPKGKVGETVDAEQFANGLQSLCQAYKRHSEASWQITMHQMNRHRPWALPGDDQTIPF